MAEIGKTASSPSSLWRRRFTGTVRCVDCGFLYPQSLQRIWGSVRQGIVADEVETPVELYPNDRERLRFRQYRGVAQLACLRHQQFYSVEEAEEPLRQDELDRRIYSGALAGRQCRFYFSYRPGYSPRDHLLLQEHRERLREERSWAARHLLAAVLIALAGMLLGVLLVLALTPGRAAP